jgi:DMSO/TMAO reductase YedYZ heme-binding membrane subunit
MLFIVFSLAVTPARRLFAAAKLINMRRTLGVTAFCYALLHLTLYVVEQKYDLAKVLSEIVLRIYLTIGFVALIGLIALAVTSTDGMIRRLGAHRWNRLHRIVYAIAVLGIIHFLMQTKLDISDSVMVAGFLFWLFGYRLVHRYLGEVTYPPVGRADIQRRRADGDRGGRLVRRDDRRDVVARILGQSRLRDGAAPGALGGDHRTYRHVRGLRVVVPVSSSRSPQGARQGLRPAPSRSSPAADAAPR